MTIDPDLTLKYLREAAMSYGGVVDERERVKESLRERLFGLTYMEAVNHLLSYANDMHQHFVELDAHLSTGGDTPEDWKDVL